MKPHRIRLPLLALLAVQTAGAATFTVTNTLDTGAGSLRAAITSLNATGGATNLIQFNILPTNTVQTITLASALPAITRQVTIDGYTQPGASPNTNSPTNGFSGALQIELNGANIGLVGLRLLGGGRSTIRGLVINRCGRGVLISSSSNNVVEGCFIGVNPAGASAQVNDLGIFIEFDGGGNISSFNRIGGTNAAARNVISGNNTGVFIQAGTNNVVQGNLIGTDATGTNGLANSTGVSLAASDTLIGGTNVAARNIIAGGFSGIFVGHVTGTRIQGNLIGTDSTGSKALGLTLGIQLDSTASATQIGGPTATPGAPPGNVVTSSSQGSFAIAVGVSEGGANGNIIQGNLVCTDATGRNRLGNARFGIANYGAFNLISSNVISGSVGEAGLFMGSSVPLVHDNLIQGNFIGPDITGTNLIGNAGNGIYVLLAISNTIQSNVIAGNQGQGVYIDNPGTTAQAVLGNSIFANAGLGILLGSGANNSQTNPVITSAATGLGNVTLGGSLKSGSNAVYHLEFFSNASCDGSGFGEGQVFLGATNLTTDANGNVSFSVILANPAGHANFTATATDTNGNTSAFSPCASVSGPCNVICPSNMVVSTAPNRCDAVVNFVPTTTGNCGAVNSTPPSGSFFPKGTNLVTCTSANGSNCSFTIIVKDTVAPTITCPANIVTNVPQAQTNAVVNYPAAVFGDNCGLVSSNSSPASGSLFPLGVTTVTCTATDTSSNSNTCSFTVTVTHSNAPPVAQCRNVTTNANASCQADVSAGDVDNGSSDPDGTIVSRTLNPPGPYAKGTNAVTLTVVDNLGASNSCAASIIVVDTTPPAIICPGSFVTNAPPGQTNLVVNFPAPTVTENCPGGTTNCTPASGSIFPVGVTTVNCTATDASGNTNTCSFTVTVNSTAADRFWTNSLGGTYQVASNWLGNAVPGAFDNANFTNNASYQVNWSTAASAASAFFNANSGTVTQAIGVFPWTLTTSYIVGQNPGSTATVTFANGFLRVTNAARTALFEVRRGTERFNAGQIEADLLVVTNTAGKFEFNGGTLITRGGTIANGLEFDMGVSGATPAIWDARAGANVTLTSSLLVGSNVPGCQLFITNGGKLLNSAMFLGYNATSVSNAVFVSGSNSVLNVDGFLGLGSDGGGNQIQISNGGSMTNANAQVGFALSASNNLVRVTGPGSTWISTTLQLGFQGARNQMIVENGGRAVVTGSAQIGGGGLATANSNSVLVTGIGSVWTNAGVISLGSFGAFSSLVISNGGAVFANSFTIGANTSSTNNRAVIDGGTLRMTNAALNAALDIRRGTNQLNSGLIEADRLLMTNTLGIFEFNGGTLNVRNSTVTNAQTFVAGNGTSGATFNLVGTGNHSFANGLTIRSNASLIGNGTIAGALSVQSGGTLSPGTSIGTLVLNSPPLLQGKTVMEISKSGSFLTNDVLQVNGPLNYGGSLTVSNIGPTALAPGNRFQLFKAGSYSGGFSNLILPPLAAGLTWTNQLLLDGSLQVTAITRPQFSQIRLTGTNLIFGGSGGISNASFTVLASTNLALPVTNWVPLFTNQFNSSGNFLFTNFVSSSFPQRFYMLRLP